MALKNAENFKKESYEKFKSESLNNKILDSKTLPKSKDYYSAPFFTKLTVLLKRTFLSTSRDPKAFYLYLVQTVFIAAFGIMLYYNLTQDYGDSPLYPTNIKAINNRIGSFFFLLLNCYFGVLANSAFKMVGENQIIYKEIKSRMYSISLFYFTKFFCDLLFLVLPIVIIVTPVKK